MYTINNIERSTECFYFPFVNNTRTLGHSVGTFKTDNRNYLILPDKRRYLITGKLHIRYNEILCAYAHTHMVKLVHGTCCHKISF